MAVGVSVLLGCFAEQGDDFGDQWAGAFAVHGADLACRPVAVEFPGLDAGMGAEHHCGNQSDAEPGSDECEREGVVGGFVADPGCDTGSGCQRVEADTVWHAGFAGDPMLGAEIGEVELPRRRAGKRMGCGQREP